MSSHRRRTDIIADPSFVADLTDLDVATLRSRRRMCLDVERELSYHRRLLHGRLDLIDFEQRRRRGDEPSDALASLGEILNDDVAGTARVTADALATDACVGPDPGRRPIDLVLGDDTVGRLGELTDDQLATARSEVESVERVISAQRRTVHQAEATLATELAGRYRAGTISTDELITG